MTKEKILSELEKDSFNGQITIDEFRERVKKYAEIHHTEQCNLGVVSARYSLKDMEQIFFAGYFHPPIKNDETEEGLDSAFKAVIGRHNSNGAQRFGYE